MWNVIEFFPQRHSGNPELLVNNSWIGRILSKSRNAEAVAGVEVGARTLQEPQDIGQYVSGGYILERGALWEFTVG